MVPDNFLYTLHVDTGITAMLITPNLHKCAGEITLTILTSVFQNFFSI